MARESERPRHRERSHHHEQKRRARKSKHQSSSSQSGSQLLSADALAQLDRLNLHRPERAAEETPPRKTRRERTEEATPKKTRRKQPREIIVDEKIEVVESPRREHKERKRKSRRVVSGALLEEGDGPTLKNIRGGEKYDRYEEDSYGDGRTLRVRGGARYDRYEKESSEGLPPKSKRKCRSFWRLLRFLEAEQHQG